MHFAFCLFVFCASSSRVQSLAARRERVRQSSNGLRVKVSIIYNGSIGESLSSHKSSPDSFPHSVTLSFIHFSVRLFIRSFIRFLIHSFIHSLIVHSFSHSSLVVAAAIPNSGGSARSSDETGGGGMIGVFRASRDANFSSHAQMEPFLDDPH